jgi:hypothetical protein
MCSVRFRSAWLHSSRAGITSSVWCAEYREAYHLNGLTWIGHQLVPPPDAADRPPTGQGLVVPSTCSRFQGDTDMASSRLRKGALGVMVSPLLHGGMCGPLAATRPATPAALQRRSKWGDLALSRPMETTRCLQPASQRLILTATVSRSQGKGSPAAEPYPASGPCRPLGVPIHGVLADRRADRGYPLSAPARTPRTKYRPKKMKPSSGTATVKSAAAICRL